VPGVSPEAQQPPAYPPHTWWVAANRGYLLGDNTNNLELSRRYRRLVDTRLGMGYDDAVPAYRPPEGQRGEGGELGRYQPPYGPPEGESEGEPLPNRVPHL